MSPSDTIILKFFDYGVFAVLFLYLFMYLLRTNKEREEKYINLIHELADKLDLLTDIADTLKALKRDLDDLHDKMDRIEREIWDTKRGGGNNEP
jgi:septal ring factor EnvC (AmiA/AmiB activator)